MLVCASLWFAVCVVTGVDSIISFSSVEDIDKNRGNAFENKVIYWKQAFLRTYLLLNKNYMSLFKMLPSIKICFICGNIKIIFYNYYHSLMTVFVDLWKSTGKYLIWLSSTISVCEQRWFMRIYYRPKRTSKRLKGWHSENVNRLIKADYLCSGASSLEVDCL